MKKQIIIGIIAVFMFIISLTFMQNSVSASEWTARDEQEKATGTTAATTESITLALDNNGMVVVDGVESKRTTYINKMLEKLTVVMTGFAGIADIILFVVLVKNITGFTASGNNPAKRSSSITKIIINVIAIALCGGACVVFALLYNSFR